MPALRHVLECLKRWTSASALHCYVQRLSRQLSIPGTARVKLLDAVCRTACLGMKALPGTWELGKHCLLPADFGLKDSTFSRYAAGV
jgi:hypothetical protein